MAGLGARPLALTLAPRPAEGHVAAMRTISHLPLALAAVLIAGSAAAQVRPPPPTRAPTLAEQLRLTPEQDGAWRAYRDELALERADAAQARSQLEQLNALTTPQRLDRTLAQLPQREAQARRAAAATRAFYAALLPDQRATFDRLTRVQGPPAPAMNSPAPAARPAPDRPNLSDHPNP